MLPPVYLCWKYHNLPPKRRFEYTIARLAWQRRRNYAYNGFEKHDVPCIWKARCRFFDFWLKTIHTKLRYLCILHFSAIKNTWKCLFCLYALCNVELYAKHKNKYNQIIDEMMIIHSNDKFKNILRSALSIRCFYAFNMMCASNR